MERLLLFRALDGLLNVRLIDSQYQLLKVLLCTWDYIFLMGVFSLALRLRIDAFGSSDGCHLCSVGNLFCAMLFIVNFPRTIEVRCFDSLYEKTFELTSVQRIEPVQDVIATLVARRFCSSTKSLQVFDKV